MAQIANDVIITLQSPEVNMLHSGFGTPKLGIHVRLGLCYYLYAHTLLDRLDILVATAAGGTHDTTTASAAGRTSSVSAYSKRALPARCSGWGVFGSGLNTTRSRCVLFSLDQV